MILDIAITCAIVWLAIRSVASILRRRTAERVWGELESAQVARAFRTRHVPR